MLILRSNYTEVMLLLPQASVGLYSNYFGILTLAAQTAGNLQSEFIYSKVNNLHIRVTLHLCYDCHFCDPFRGDTGTSSGLSLESIDKLRIFVS